MQNASQMFWSALVSANESAHAQNVGARTKTDSHLGWRSSQKSNKSVREKLGFTDSFDPSVIQSNVKCVLLLFALTELKTFAEFLHMQYFELKWIT